MWLPRIILALAMGAAAVWLYLWMFPSPEKVIRKNLVAMAQLASFGPNEAPLAKFSNTQKLMGYFANEVQLAFEVPGRGEQTISGFDELRQAVMHARSSLTSLQVQLYDIQVTVERDRSRATADLTAKASIGGDRDPYVQEMLFTFAKVSGDWLISRIEPVKTLR